MDISERIHELEKHKGREPPLTVQRACQAIEIVLREVLKLPKGSSLAALQEEFRNRYPGEMHLHYKLTTLRKLRNAIVHEDRQPWPGDEEIAIGTLKNFAHFVGEEGLAGAVPMYPDVPMDTVGSLKLASTTRYMVPNSMSMEQVDKRPRRLEWKNFEMLVGSHFEDLLGVQFHNQVTDVLNDGSKHIFDLVSKDGQIAIECKSHTWTKSGNYPSAKVTDSKITAECLKKHPAKRKLLVFQDDFWEHKSLAETFMRRNIAALKGIEIWAYSNGRFKRLGE